MPLHNCHPLAPHTKLKMPEGYVSSLMMERAVDAVMRRVGKLDREHDIPYLAGYSMNGKIIYIDRAMPTGFKLKGTAVFIIASVIITTTVATITPIIKTKATKVNIDVEVGFGLSRSCKTYSKCGSSSKSDKGFA